MTVRPSVTCCVQRTGSATGSTWSWKLLQPTASNARRSSKCTTLIGLRMARSNSLRASRFEDDQSSKKRAARSGDRDVSGLPVLGTAPSSAAQSKDVRMRIWKGVEPSSQRS